MRDLIVSLLSRGGKYTCIECVEINGVLNYTGVSMWDGEDSVYEYRFLHTDAEVVHSDIASNNLKRLFGGNMGSDIHSVELSLTEKLNNGLTIYGDLEEWKNRNRPHPEKSAIVSVVRSIMASWSGGITKIGKIGDFEVAVVSELEDSVIVTFKYKGKVQEPIKLFLLRKTAVRLRNYGADSDVFKQFIESMCPVVWY